MVIFTSRSEKKAHIHVRRVLDLFAERIGNDTWKTVITAEGLRVVKTLLRRTATKNTAVACHWIRSRSRTELLWVVGQRNQFNEEGAVPVSRTEKDLNRRSWENGWTELSLIQALVAVAALFHDWGKGSDYFQSKLRRHSMKMDPFRHEWVSCKLVEAVVRACGAETDDRKWLSALAEGTLDGEAVAREMRKNVKMRNWGQIGKLPPVAEALIWLILSHHRMPRVTDETKTKYKGENRQSFSEMIASLSADWGYQNEEMGDKERCQCFTFSHGLLWGEAPVWTKLVRKWSGRLLSNLEKAEDMERPRFRLVLLFARLCLMMGDHYVSSKDSADTAGRIYGTVDLWANSQKGKPFIGRQRLEEHLTEVCRQALRIAYELPRFAGNMERAEDVRSLRQKSPKQYAWQDRAAEKVREVSAGCKERPHWFLINMASTGCGKTLANAKLMQAVSEDGRSLRYNLALGLRTLTLQTGDEYRTRVGLDSSDMAVLIGSSPVRELYERSHLMSEEGQPDTSDLAAAGSESEAALLDETLDYMDTMDRDQQDFMDLFFGKNNRDREKNGAFLYKPVLVSTIDYLMRGTETKRGGRYMLPWLRLMESDLVIDEIDDFNKEDLTAIARLVHLAGMFGRNVGISSATIPPDLAEGMYRAYVAGLAVYQDLFEDHRSTHVLWCDEFRAQAADLTEQADLFMEKHRNFIEKRVRFLREQPARRRGKICAFSMKEGEAEGETKERYFETIKNEAAALHRDHHVTDARTGRKISFGLIRMANINPCVELSQYMLRCDWPKDMTVRLMTYHSRQILLLRHEQERYLDRVLKRSGEMADAADITDPILRRHIDVANTEHVLFLVAATPVEEVGRDHDFDWAVVEPSSYRSIIQLSGRILRHRNLKENIRTNNVTVMEYNINGLRGCSLAFCRPGYETGGAYKFASHSVKALLDENDLFSRIDAVPRIRKQIPLHPATSLADMEQKVMEDFNQKPGDGIKLGSESLEGWLHQCWWMTALPQQLNPFRRQTQEEVQLTVRLGENGLRFWEEVRKDVNIRYGISEEESLSEAEWQRLWLPRNYRTSLVSYANMDDMESEEEALKKAAFRYGEITLPVSDGAPQKWLYSDQFGLYRKEED